MQGQMIKYINLFIYLFIYKLFVIAYTISRLIIDNNRLILSLVLIFYDAGFLRSVIITISLK